MTSSRWRVSASRAYELSPDLREKQVEMLCRKYGGATLASHAARVIQAAYRRYRLSRSFARMRLEAAVASPATVDRRLSRGFTDADVETPRGGVCCRVHARPVAVADAPYGHFGWTSTERHRMVQKSHSVTVTTTTAAARHHHHQRVLVREGRCVSPATGWADPRGPAPPEVAALADDELALPPSSIPSVDDIITMDYSQPDQPHATTTTFQQLCLTDSSYGDMSAIEADSDADDHARSHYVDNEALEEPTPSSRTHVYSSLRLCSSSSKHSGSVAEQARNNEVADSPIWKRKEVVGEGDSESTTARCVGCGWRGQSELQIIDDHPVTIAAASSSISSGSLATIGK